MQSLLDPAREDQPLSPERWFEVAYDELRELASRLLERERPDHTLQATALVHEAWLRLAGSRGIALDGRERFLAAAATAMRHVLVNHALARRTQKRGGARLRVRLDGDLLEAQTRGIDLVGLDVALTRLARLDPQAARVVELRFFARLSEDEIATVLGTSARTVRRDWSAAKAYLRAEIARGDPA
jgi:RNA polymerase sigma factor (TIGR02999 family)